MVLDDFEGFTDESKRRVASLLKQESSDRVRLNPIVITCTQFREAGNRDLRDFADLRLWKPNEQPLCAWLSKSYPSTWVADERALVRKGDVRAVEQALKMRTRFASRAVNASSSGADHTFANSFEATRRLLLRTTSANAWAQQAERRDVDLLREHFVACMPNQEAHLERVSSFYDSLSVADVLSPDRFELQSAQTPLLLHMVAYSVLLTSTARDVGALAPPARAGRGPCRTPEDVRAAGCLQGASPLEVPSLLRAATGS